MRLIKLKCFHNKLFPFRYGEYPELCGILHKYIRPKDIILVVGCGNSKLSQDLYDVGYSSITNIDLSGVVIKQMMEANKTRTGMSWSQMDATAMNFDAENFSVVLDKGTLDAMCTDDSMEVQKRTQKYFSEVSRVLSEKGGRFVCITLLQSHILKLLLDFFSTNNFMFRVVRCMEAEKKTAETSASGQSMPVFVVVATKFKLLQQKLFEVCLVGEIIQRLSDEREIRQAIESIQQAAMIQNGLTKNSQAALDSEIQLELYKPNTSVPRYKIYVLDQKPMRGNGQFACFVVPQGREMEWLFSTTEGRRKLQESSKHNRLAIVSMQRDHSYASLDSVQRELDSYITSLAQNDLKGKIPYLSLGTDVGQREKICSGTSDQSGPYVVEDISISDNKTLRRLIFLNNQNTIQSEAAVKIVKSKKGLKKAIDKTYLSCQHHLYMTVGLNLSAQQEGRNLVIGLGGGALCTFIHQCLPSIHIIAVEIDPVILDIATKYFGLTINEKIEVKIQDGLEYLKEATRSSPQVTFNSILFDVDSKDSTVGISCPPKAFLEATVLNAVKILIGTSGVFVLNLVCRDNTLRDQVVHDLRQYFSSICTFKLDEDLNEIIYCRNLPLTSSEWQQSLEKSAKQINTLSKKQKIDESCLIDINEFIEGLKI